MSGRRFVLAIDQGTTSTRAIVFDDEGRPCTSAQVPLTQIYPAPGEVEHDPEEIWQSVLKAGRAALKDIGAQSVAAIGITNQRETTIVWERATGKPLANAIVWQDRRTARHCDELKGEGWGAHVEETTGLVIDPYFSATKLAWLLANVPELQERARKGEVCFGTVDSFLLFRLTGGKVHATEASNAARTMLHDIRHGAWDDRLLDRLAIPREILPDLRDSQDDFGLAEPAHFGASIPIRGIAGDQQAAAYGHACFLPGMLKATYGTGCFLLANTGEAKVSSSAHARDRVSSASGQAHLRARGIDLHGRRHGAMAARQPWLDRGRRGQRRPRRPCRSQIRRLSRPCLPGPRRAALGRRGARRDPRADACGLCRRHRGCRARGWPSRPAICSTPCARTWRKAPFQIPRACGSMAA
jgi:glycerol kinase